MQLSPPPASPPVPGCTAGPPPSRYVLAATLSCADLTIDFAVSDG
jgi:hypothetical protein